MKLIAVHPNKKNTKLEIEKQLFKSLTPNEPDAYGYYLYVWENGHCTYDYLQDTLEIAIEHAEEQFGLPRDAWKKVD